jgi:hypothetical protein
VRATNKANGECPSAQVFGTQVHTLLEMQVDAAGPDIAVHAEVTYLDGDFETKKGTKGSVRLDVVLGPLNGPVAVFDYKSGKAGLSAARKKAIYAQLPEWSSDIPIRAIHVPAGAA